MDPRRSPEEILQETSRTFALPIARLEGPLRRAVAASYLCMRAVDEVEDHRGLPAARRSALLREIARALESARPDALAEALAGHERVLPEVTRRLPDWLALPDPVVAPRVAEAVSAMARRMAEWVEIGFHIGDERDLDRYTYAVAGAVGVLLADLWQWGEGLATDRRLAVRFGQGLQAVNILRNRSEDLAAGVDFLPTGWTEERLEAWARDRLEGARSYVASLPRGRVREFCLLPLRLADATLEALQAGRPKLTREEVQRIVAGALEEG